MEGVEGLCGRVMFGVVRGWFVLVLLATLGMWCCDGGEKTSLRSTW